ncbi:MAG TPA: hypothetical protein VFI47_21580 [Acidimicrobiales bacterium]|nr:hypothetical protein [Acidimicrobiales bacterium]
MSLTVRFGGVDLPVDAPAVELVNVSSPDFTPLTRLDHLRELRLTHTNPHRAPGGLPVELDPLAQLDELEVLVLRHYPIRDLGPLGGLFTLRVLDVSFSPVDDLGPLARLTGLRELRLRATRVADLAPLGGLTGLAVLDVAHTRVADLAPLHGLPDLRSVDVEGAPLAVGAVAALAAAIPGVGITV